MKIPKYIQDVMNRSSFVLGSGDPGYTIEINKATAYTLAPTFEKEINKLKAWVDRQMPQDDLGVPTMIIHSIPTKTHYGNQFARVTIYDPVMKDLEQYINK